MESPEAAEGIKTRKKYRGVYQLISGNWTGYMHDPNKKKVFTLCTFKTAEDAAMSHDKAALRFRGCRAKLNFPEHVPARIEVPGSEKQVDPLFRQLPMDHQRLQECSGQEKNPGRDRGFLGKRPMIGSCQFPPAKVDMEAQIHHLEQQAYTCVVRAFKSQSDAITGAKESLITELRKEVGVSDEEHQDLLSKVNGEELINVIREWRADGGLQESHPTVSSSRVNHDIPPSSGQFPPVQNGMDTLIHLIEQEAYTSVLRAFEARSDAITWEEKSLVTEMRKELRISEEEHQELLFKVIAEEIINDIRERRITCRHQPGISRPVQDREPHPTVSDLHKKRKISQAAMSLDVLSSMCCLPSPSRASMKGQKTTYPEDVREADQDQGILSGIECSGAGRGSQESVPHARKAGKYHIPASFNRIAESPVSQHTSMHHILQADSGPVRRSETRALQDGRSVHHEHTDEDHRPSISREPHPTVSASREARMPVKVPSSTLGQLFQPSAITPSTKQEKTTPSEDVRENDQDQGIVRGGKLRISLKGCTSIVEAPVPKQPKVGKILQTGSRQVSWPQTAALHDEGSRLRDGSKVMVMVSYKNRFVIRFELSLSSTKLEMEKIVAANLNLSVGGFGVAYQDEENDWILIGCDEHLRTCLRTSRSSGNESIRMMVVCS